MKDLRKFSDRLPNAKYSDFKILESREVQVALRPESSEVFENSSEKIVCRVIDEGYGVASSSKIDIQHAEMVSNLALKQANVEKRKIDLYEVKLESGQVKYPLKKEFDIDEANQLLIDIRNELRAKLGGFYARSELVLSHYHLDSAFFTSEGTYIKESFPFTDLTIYLVIREILQGYSSRIIGGKGGLEILEGRDWNSILDELVFRAKDMIKAKLLSPLERGRRFKIIFDSEAVGAFAHEVAHMLEADIFQKRLFKNLNIPEDLVIEDNPMIPGAYGSFTWDDEGVRGIRKTLLKKGEIELLNTRLTAREGGIPGNAHGVTHIPRPTVSNIYINPSDWRLKEIFEDTRNGIYIKGLVRAEVDTSDGKFELTPEIAYLVYKKELKIPIKHLKVTDNIKSALQRIDAIGKWATLRPNVEKGFNISEGGPHIRMNGVFCS